MIFELKECPKRVRYILKALDIVRESDLSKLTDSAHLSKALVKSQGVRRNITSLEDLTKYMWHFGRITLNDLRLYLKKAYPEYYKQNIEFLGLCYGSKAGVGKEVACPKCGYKFY